MSTIYVCPTAWWGSSGDIAGCLLIETGEVLWEHISSSIGWLRRDLTDGFSDRAEQLRQRFPDGYEVVVVDVDTSDVPQAVRDAYWSLRQQGGFSAAETRA